MRQASTTALRSFTRDALPTCARVLRLINRRRPCLFAAVLWSCRAGSACAAPGSAAATQMPPRGGGTPPRGSAIRAAALRCAGDRAVPHARARQGLLALLLLLGAAAPCRANKKSDGTASAALWAAKAAAAAASVATQAVDATGQAAAGPTASASELAAVEAPATTGPGARVGYLKLMPTPLTSIDPEVRVHLRRCRAGRGCVPRCSG